MHVSPRPRFTVLGGSVAICANAGLSIFEYMLRVQFEFTVITSCLSSHSYLKYIPGAIGSRSAAHN